MNDKKNVYLKVLVDYKTDMAFRQILKSKGLKIQDVLNDMIKTYIFDNLDCIMNNNDTRK